MKKSSKRQKLIKSTLIMPIKIELQNNSKIQHQMNSLHLHSSLRHKNIIHEKNNKNLIESASSLIDNFKIYRNNNPFSSLNSPNTESNLFKLNNSNNNKKNNSFFQQRNSFYVGPSLKSEKISQVQKEKEIKIKILKKDKIFKLKKFNNTDENQPYKEYLPHSVNKNNPVNLFETSLRKTNKNMDFYKKDNKIFFNSTNNRVSSALIKSKKNKEKKILKLKKMNNSNKDKKLLANKKESFEDFIKKNNNINKLNSIINNINNTLAKQKIDQYIAINNSCYNPILQYLDNSYYIRSNGFYTCKTENIDDIKNNSTPIIKNNDLKLTNYPLIKFQENTTKNFPYYKINLVKLKSDNETNIIGQRQFADASSDTNLDKVVFSNNLKKNPINRINPQLNNDEINSNMFNKYKAFIPKNKLYKNSKYFKKSKISNKNEEKKGYSNLSNVKFYNFKDIVDLFGKKIDLSKKPKISGYFNKFRNKSCKFYSSSNNLEITLIRKFNLKNLKKTKLLSNIREQTTKDSNKDFYEDIEDSITKKFK